MDRSLAYRHMNFTLRQLETESARRDAEQYARMSDEEKAEPVHYWWVERKVVKQLKRGIKIEWVWMRDLVATKKDAARYWMRHGAKGERLHHRMEYGKGLSK